MKSLYTISMIALIGLSYNLSFGGNDATADKKSLAPEKKPETATLENIHSQLKDLQLSIQAIKSVDHDSKLLKIEAELIILKDQISRLEQAINKLSSTRVAASFNPTATGTIKIANTSYSNASVIINGKVYKVQANQTLPVPNVNSGDFTYEVLADGFGIIQKQTTRSLAANETFTINIYPK